MPPDAELNDAMEGVLDHANEAITPTVKVGGVESAYWTDVTSKEFLRWVLPHEEAPALDALARLHAASADRLVDGARLVGMFRAHGLLVPVWDLAAGTGAEAIESPLANFAQAFEAALADETPLSPAERGTRAGLTSRQLTLR